MAVSNNAWDGRSGAAPAGFVAPANIRLLTSVHGDRKTRERLFHAMKDISGNWLSKLTRRTPEDLGTRLRASRPEADLARVRAMEPADIRPVQDVARRTWARTYRDTIPREVQDKFLERAYSRASLERRMVSDVFLVAALDGEVVGFADFEPASRTAAYLGALYVLPDRQRCGTGARLPHAGIASFPPATKFILRVEKHNARAEAFYRRHGFEVTGEATEYLFGHESREVEMTLLEEG